MSQLGAVYSHKGDYNQAIKLYQHTLKVRVEKLGRRHPGLHSHHVCVASKRDGFLSRDYELLFTENPA